MEMPYKVWDREGSYPDIPTTVQQPVMVLAVSTIASCLKPSGTSHATGERKTIT